MSFINMDKRFKISKMLINNYIFILIMLMLAMHRGSKVFGYDSASSCNPNGKMSRRGRAQMIATIPCDLSRQPYCNLPGTSYPWHAVRRFVHENQGLMKRMYGDVRHISVLRDEIQNNEIDVEDIEMAAMRYSRNAFRRSSKFMHQHDEESGIGNNLRNTDIVLEPHFRPIITATRATTKTTTPSSTTSIEKTISDSNDTTQTTEIDSTTDNNNKDIQNQQRLGTTESIINKTNDHDHENLKFESRTNEEKPTTSTGTEKVIQFKLKSDDNNLVSNSVYELPTFDSNELLIASTSGANIEIVESPKLNTELRNLTDSSSTISTTLKETKTISTVPTIPATTTTTTTATSASTLTFESTSTTTQATRKVTADVYRRRPQYPIRYRPSQQQQHNKQQPQKQQLHRVDSIDFSTKEKPSVPSTKSKPPIIESERLPANLIFNTNTTTITTTTTKPLSASSITQSITSVKGVNVDSTFSPAYSSNKNHKPQAIDLSLAATSLPPSPPTNAGISLASIKPTIEQLSGEKLHEQPVSVANNQIVNSTVTSTTPSSNNPTTKSPVLRDGQLYQDTVKQESTPLMNLKGVNACPTKEEVVAPFWANNTRGEVLALLNLYPFEQYVHWEKCTHENKQMYCREGCRCEQQYRLHRLLAYDPHNECRGIFSDWFRFPSCCICRCYNIPVDFRATSRSPRMQSFPEDRDEDITTDIEDQRHPLEIAEEEVKRAIYEHATEDWYRPRDEFDYLED